MPTAGNLTGAILYAILGGVVAYLTLPLFVEGDAPDFWYPLCIVSGLICGWSVMGNRVGQGYSVAVGTAVTAAGALAFWALLLTSITRMIQKSMRGQYDGPTDAVIATFGIMGDYALLFATPVIIGTLVAGGLIAGLVTEAVGRRYR
ncbi:TrgA family protein [Loktanella sp. SALINAS62]|uniref:TrgA family protein n=1 Tax=Loktanella sp. SALINAS62 TaxID=2706124 RepID=UPI001B8AB347|nr:TrgA family protein [Loktanella sp. SALINAS62]MBS1303502.1 EscU/YscU/HrcU family type III secretion system export apparatus switch protein [Loktanella sp. SALINAS62]